MSSKPATEKDQDSSGREPELAAETLRRSETGLKKAREMAHLGSWKLDLVRNTLTWSDEVYRIFGLQPGEFEATYEAFLEAVHPEDRAAVDAAYTSSVREGRDTYEIEHRIVRKTSGEVRVVYEICEHFRDGSDRIVLSIGMVLDITERKQIEEAIRESEARFQTVIRNLRSGVALIDETGKFAIVNPAFMRLFGLDSELDILNVNSQNWSRWEVYGEDGSLLPFDDHPVRKAAMTGKPVKNRLIAVRSPGAKELTWMLINAEPMPLEDGRSMIICTYYDITERMQAEEALKAGNEKIKEILASIRDDFYVLGRDWKFVYVNRQFTTRIGKEPEDFIGNNIWEMFPGHLGTILEENFRAAMDKREIRRFEVGGKYTDHWYSMTAYPSAEGITVQGTEITERKLRDERIARLAGLYKVLSRVNETIVRVHDVRLLFEEVCKIVADDGGFPLVWIGQVEGRLVVPACVCGPAAEYLKEIRVEIQGPLSMGPTGTCIREGRVVINDDFGTNLSTLPWREFALKYGLHASAALPLYRDGNVIGAFTLYASHAGAFDVEQMRLLQSLSADISYALEALDHEQQHLRAVESMRKLSKAVEESPATVVITDIGGTIEYVNPKFTQITGYSLEEAIGKNPRILKSGKTTPEEYEHLWDTIRAGSEWRGEFLNRKKDGELYWESAVIAPIKDAQGLITGFIAIKEDVTERKRLEEALKDRERQLKSRLNAILTPGDAGARTLTEIVDVEALQGLADSFYTLTGVATSIIDLEGRVLIGAGWQDICTKFHRCHPETSKNCTESDLHLSGSVEEGKYVMYKCKNGMWDIVTPIVVNGKHMANLFTGQFFFDDETPDYDYFRQQADRFGFDRSTYMAALDRAPRHSREKIHRAMGFYIQFAGLISQLSYSNVQLARVSVEQKRTAEELQDVNEQLEAKSEELAVQAEKIERANEELRSNNMELQSVTRSLREAQDYLESLITYANAPIIVWDPKFTVTRFNRAFERLSGYTADEVIGNDLSILFPPDSRKETLDKIKKTLEGEYWESMEIPILHKYGSTRIALWNSANIYAADNTLRATIAQGQDITTRKFAEQAMEEAKAQAELYLDLMGHDISNMHHIAIGQLELAREIMDETGKLEGEDIELIDTPLESLRRSARIIDNVRKLQELRSDECSLETIDLTEMLTDVLKGYSSIPGKHLVIDFVPGARSPVRANPLLKDVFCNLVDNAVKHSGDHLALTVEIGRLSLKGTSYYRVAIEDNGIGIPDDKKEEVFHRFKRGQTKAKGTGLGLYIVKTLVEGFRGHVEIQNRVLDDYTKGTRFIVYLPALEE